VNDKQTRDVGENIDKRPRVVWIGGKTGFWFKDDAHSTDGWQAAVSTCDRQLHLVVDSREECREHIRLKTAGVEQVVLEELTRPVGFGVSLGRQLTMGPSCDSDDLIL